MSNTSESLDFLSLPKLVQELVLQDFTISSAFEVPIVASVCKRFHELLFLDKSSTPMWKRLVLNRWVFVRTRSAVTDWQAMYRHRSIKQNMDEADLTVENCALESQFEWQLNCPVVLSKIARTHDPKVDYCSQCKEHVYICSSIEELTAHVDQKHCVAFDSDGALLSSRIVRPRFMGMMIRRR